MFSTKHQPDSAQQEQARFLSLQKAPCSYQHASWEKGILAEARTAASGSGWSPKVTCKQGRDSEAAEPGKAAQSVGLAEAGGRGPRRPLQGAAVQGEAHATAT